MVIENAVITIDPARAAEFEAAVAAATPIFRAAEGCRGMALQRIVEEDGRYRLLVTWETIEHHKTIFWNSPGFQHWRSLAAQFYDETPLLEYDDPLAVHI